MAKVFYTERDIEDLSRQGVASLTITDNVVVTDLAREKARKLGIELVLERHSAPVASQPAPVIAPRPAAAPAAPRLAPQSGSELEARVYNAVKSKLGDQVDDALLRTIVKRVLNSLGRG